MRNRKHEQQTKIEIARQVIEVGKKQADISRETGINPNLVSQWVILGKRGELEGYKPPENRYENFEPEKAMRLLQKELKELKMENDFLKKAAAFFAKTTR